MVQVSANLHDEKMIGWAMALVLMEKKYGKWLLYLASPRALVWGGWLWLKLVVLSVSTGMKHWYLLFLNTFDRYGNLQFAFLSLSDTKTKSKNMSWCTMKKGGV